MREHPVFVPCGRKYIAAVVALPDEMEPQAVVLFTPGGGGTLRSHLFRLWTKAARELADRGIATVRMEFAGIGDSTGEVAMGFNNLPAEDVQILAQFAMEAAGTTKLGLCGSCGGARTSLKAVRSLPTCESMVLFWLKPQSERKKPRPILSRVMRVAYVLPIPVRRSLKRIFPRIGSRVSRSRVHPKASNGRGDDVVSSLAAIAPHTDLLLIESQTKIHGSIQHVIDGLRRTSPTNRIELRGVNGTSMHSLKSPVDQQAAVDHVVNWFTGSFIREDAASTAAASHG